MRVIRLNRRILDEYPAFAHGRGSDVRLTSVLIVRKEICIRALRKSCNRQRLFYACSSWIMPVGNNIATATNAGSLLYVVLCHVERLVLFELHCSIPVAICTPQSTMACSVKSFCSQWMPIRFVE